MSEFQSSVSHTRHWLPKSNTEAEGKERNSEERGRSRQRKEKSVCEERRKERIFRKEKRSTSTTQVSRDPKEKLLAERKLAQEEEFVQQKRREDTRKKATPAQAAGSSQALATDEGGVPTTDQGSSPSLRGVENNILNSPPSVGGSNIMAQTPPLLGGGDQSVVSTPATDLRETIHRLVEREKELAPEFRSSIPVGRPGEPSIKVSLDLSFLNSESSKKEYVDLDPFDSVPGLEGFQLTSLRSAISSERKVEEIHPRISALWKGARGGDTMVAVKTNLVEKMYSSAPEFKAPRMPAAFNLTQKQVDDDCRLAGRQKRWGLLGHTLCKTAHLLEEKCRELHQLPVDSDVKVLLLPIINDLREEATQPLGHGLRMIAADFNEIGFRRRTIATLY